MNLFLTISAYGQIVLWIVALHLLFFQHGCTFAEAAAYALMTTLMLLSFVFQLAFLLGTPKLAYFLEIPASVAAALTVIRLRRHFRRLTAILLFMAARQPLPMLALLVLLSFLALLAGLTPLAGRDSELLTVLDTVNCGAILSDESNPSPLQGLFPLNAAIIPHLFYRATRLPAGNLIGINLIGFLAYLATGFATYALCRRYAWPDTALTVTLISISFPRLVFLAISPGIEIVPAAASLFCILAIYRSLEQPNISDLLLLVSGIFFSISATQLALAFPAILMLLAGVLFFRRHGAITWISLLRSHPKTVLAALAPLVVFSQMGLFVLYGQSHGLRLGVYWPAGAVIEGNVLLGIAANLVRYFGECLFLALPVDRLVSTVVGFSLNAELLGIYQRMVLPLVGMSGAAAPFAPAWSPDGSFSWFGPLGILLVAPAILLSTFRAHQRLKAIAVALAGYVYLITLLVAWMPGNAAYFTTVFVCGGVCVAFLMPPWRLTRFAKTVLQVICILLLVYGSVFQGLAFFKSAL